MYAAELNALAIGQEIRFMKKYRYNGENREKPIHGWVKTIFFSPEKVELTVGATQRTSVYNSFSHNLSFDTEVALIDAK